MRVFSQLLLSTPPWSRWRCNAIWLLQVVLWSNLSLGSLCFSLVLFCFYYQHPQLNLFKIIPQRASLVSSHNEPSSWSEDLFRDHSAQPESPTPTHVWNVHMARPSGCLAGPWLLSIPGASPESCKQPTRSECTSLRRRPWTVSWANSQSLVYF